MRVVWFFRHFILLWTDAIAYRRNAEILWLNVSALYLPTRQNICVCGILYGMESWYKSKYLELKPLKLLVRSFSIFCLRDRLVRRYPSSNRNENTQVIPFKSVSDSTKGKNMDAKEEEDEANEWDGVVRWRTRGTQIPRNSIDCSIQSVDVHLTQSPYSVFYFLCCFFLLFLPRTRLYLRDYLRHSRRICWYYSTYIIEYTPNYASTT